ncbi:hypothetical protein [Streptomyces sp. NBC_01483]|uniref:hypothetical protein n=1 Tax=Streptomyces sp. NBC_01483 TaxID=2903883 RepID=UPI002E33A23F|nr:hypothetical protein [Streptomyces sp. NBC_01483]
MAGHAEAVAAVRVPVAVRQATPTQAGAGTDYDQRPPAWRAGLDEEALSGVYRQVFTAAAMAAGPVTAQELTRALGGDATRMNEVEKGGTALTRSKRGTGCCANAGCSGLLRVQPVGSPLRPVQPLPRHPAGQRDQGGPPHHLLVVIGTALVVAVQSAVP